MDRSSPAAVVGVIRRTYLLGRLDGAAATLALEDLESWPGERYGHCPLLERARELRHAVRGWDATYVALAEALRAPLLTTDGQLDAAHGPACEVELIPRTLAT